MGRSLVRCERNIKLIVTLLHGLGFVVHPNKSIFVPARSNKHLGFVIDSQSMTISLTKKKKACIKQLLHKVLQEKFLILRKMSRLLGKFTSSFPAVHYGNGIKFSHSNLPKEILTKR